MKKFISKTIMLLLAAALCVSAAACGGSSWSKSDVSLKEWGEIKAESNGGFIAETKNYVYYINGSGNSSDDNSFGTPVKGALVAAKKADIEEGKENVEKCIVVPKLFVASDYKMGVFIHGDYVYYATPSTDKTSSGDVASSEIQFMKTKLDGSSSEDLLKAGAISDQYRIFESGGAVYIAVYDSANTKLICYNTSDKTQVEIAKTDEKTDGNESLNAYLFADASFASNGVVVYTTTVYSEKYDENAANSNSSYQRGTESYNKVYVYKAGAESAKCVLDGSSSKNSYSLTQISGEYLYYTMTASSTLGDGTSSYAVKISDLYAGNAGDKIYNADYVSASNIVISPEEIYTLNSDTGVVRKVSLKDKAKAEEKTVANLGTSATISFVKDGYIYYYNENNEFLRIELNNVSAKYEKISVGATNSASSWYAPEIIGDFFYYADTSAEGCGYIKAVCLKENNRVSVDADGKKTTVNDDIDHYYFDKNVSLGIFTEDDLTTVVSEKISSITAGLNGGKLVFDTDDDGKVKEENGVPVITKIAETRKAYDALSSDCKEKIETDYETFKNYEKAYEISKILYKLNDFDKLSKTAKDALKPEYENAKAALANINSEEYDVSMIKGLCVENMLWFYQTANAYFTK